MNPCLDEKAGHAPLAMMQKAGQLFCRSWLCQKGMSKIHFIFGLLLVFSLVLVYTTR